MLPTLLASIGIFAAIAFVTIIAFYVYYKQKNKRTQDLLALIPGPKAKYPLMGNIDLFRHKGVPLNECVYRTLVALCKLYDKHGMFRIDLGPKALVVLFKHNTMDAIFASNSQIDKSEQYFYIFDWLGDGLLLSTGNKWRKRRKLLTSAFHFRILDDFIPIMNEQSDVLVNKLMKVDKHGYIDIREPITQCTLDIICETAMGVSIGAQLGNNAEYVTAIHDLGEILMKRVFSPWIAADFIFYKTPMGRKFKQSLNTLHSFTRTVIEERKSQYMEALNGKPVAVDTKPDDNIYLSDKKRRRLAFLDLLLDYHVKDNALTIDDMREEVDTFMFEGHDTTSVSMSWTLYLLGRHPKVQDRLHEELDAVFGTDITRDITAEDIARMTYLDAVLKESLRMYPSVPFIGRKLNEDFRCRDYVIPKDTNVFLFIERMHYDPEVFPEPLRFLPERFLENSTSNINAYTYVPFSAGARSCIGKRFAVTEEKIILAKVCLNFRLESLEPLDKIQPSSEMVFRAKDALNVRFTPKY